MNDNLKNAKSILLSFRHKERLSQYAMAKRLGISRDTLANYETERTRIPADILLKFYLPELYQNPPHQENQPT